VLRTQIKTANERIGTIKYDETTIADQQKRYAELVAASKGVQAEVVERTRQMQLLSEELARAYPDAEHESPHNIGLDALLAAAGRRFGAELGIPL
jgi:hypothetical protein